MGLDLGDLLADDVLGDSPRLGVDVTLLDNSTKMEVMTMVVITAMKVISTTRARREMSADSKNDGANDRSIGCCSNLSSYMIDII